VLAYILSRVFSSGKRRFKPAKLSKYMIENC